MRIALMTDIHGNLAALDAVLRDIERRAVDMTVNLGDVVSGPLLPRATAERLMPLGLPTIRGNHERQILTQSLGELGESDHFAALELLDEQRVWLASFPETLALDGDVLLCHGTPQNDLDYLLETIDADGFRPATVAEVEERTAGCAARLIACGHSHLPRAMRLRNGTMVLNPGSVGLQAYPARRPLPHIVEAGSPHARYAIAQRHDADWDVELIEVAYDWEAAAKTAAANGRPDWAIGLHTGRVEG